MRKEKKGNNFKDKIMKTPKEYTENIKKGIITKQMLLDCLFSVNKRAKNARDKEREYKQYYRNIQMYNRYVYDKYNNVNQYAYKKSEYYKQKDTLLSIINPTCIHVELQRYERRRIYDYEGNDYQENQKDFIWQNCYYDYEQDREVWFGDIELKEKPIYQYYLFYDLNEHSFHTPIDQKETEKYPDLEEIFIDRIVTNGEDINTLISPQFVKKILDLINSKNFVYQEA